MVDYERIHDAISAIRAKQVFFVGGAAKSGTTWVQILLDGHPEVSCDGEGHFTDALAPLLRNALDAYGQHITKRNVSVFGERPGYGGPTAEHFPYLLASAIALSLGRQAAHKPASAIGEKTPDNARAFPLLADLFPRAKFIHIVRDGRDCAVSGWFHNLRTTPDWTQRTYGTMDFYVAKFAEAWASEVDHAAAFGARQPANYAVVRYEDLCADPAPALATLFGFLGVGAAPDLVRQACAAASFERLTGGRARGDERRDSFFRKGVAGDWRQHFTDPMAAIFRAKAAAALSRYGYT